MEVKIVLVSILSFNSAIQKSVQSTLRTSERSNVSNATPTLSIRTANTTGCHTNTPTVSSVFCVYYKSILKSCRACGSLVPVTMQRLEITGVWASVAETKKRGKKNGPERNFWNSVLSPTLAQVASPNFHPLPSENTVWKLRLAAAGIVDGCSFNAHDCWGQV